MQAMSLSDRQSRELCDEIGKMLAMQLDSEVVNNKVNRIVSDYIKQKNISADAKSIAKNISWSVKVELKR